jgi:hypothetical protein
VTLPGWVVPCLQRTHCILLFPATEVVLPDCWIWDVGSDYVICVGGFIDRVNHMNGTIVDEV